MSPIHQPTTFVECWYEVFGLICRLWWPAPCLTTTTLWSCLCNGLLGVRYRRDSDRPSKWDSFSKFLALVSFRCSPSLVSFVFLLRCTWLKWNERVINRPVQAWITSWWWSVPVNQVCWSGEPVLAGDYYMQLIACTTCIPLIFYRKWRSMLITYARDLWKADLRRNQNRKMWMVHAS